MGNQNYWAFRIFLCVIEMTLILRENELSSTLFRFLVV